MGTQTRSSRDVLRELDSNSLSARKTRKEYSPKATPRLKKVIQKPHSTIQLSSCVRTPSLTRQELREDIDTPPNLGRRSSRRLSELAAGRGDIGQNSVTSPPSHGLLNSEINAMQVPANTQRRTSARLANLSSPRSDTRSNLSTEQRPQRFQAAKGLYTALMANSKVRAVDPLHCISVRQWRIRDIWRWAVQNIKSSLSGAGDSSGLVQGFVSTGKFSIVVAIPSEFLYLAIEEFVRQGKSQDEADLLSTSHTWYHVVDGGHVHQGLAEKITEEYHKFGGFRWPVVEIKWHPPDVLKSLARVCQEMQKEVHIIEFTFAEILQNLRAVFDDLCSRTGTVRKPGRALPHGTIKKVVDAYTGSSGAATNTLRSICSVAVKLSSTVVTEMKDLLTEECEDIIRTLGCSRPFGADSRVFKKLLSTQSLKGAKLFLNATKTTDDDRINVVHRMRYLSRTQQSFKGFSSSEIDAQTKLAILARELVLDFKKFLGKENWPDEMEHLRNNLLRSTMMDEDVESMADRRNELFPILKNSYVSATGARGRQLLRQHERSRQNASDSSQHVEGSDGSQAVDIMPVGSGRSGNVPGNDLDPSTGILDDPSQAYAVPESLEGEEGQNVVVKYVGEQRNLVASASKLTIAETLDCNEIQAEQPGDESGTYGEPQLQSACEENATSTSDDSLLSMARIEVHNATYEEYERNSVDVNNSFDFIICDPFQKRPGQDDIFMDEKEASNVLQFFRRMLVPGGYCFIILDWMLLRDWASFMATNQFEVFEKPFRIIKDPSKFQRQRSNEGQDMVQDALIARKPGRNPSGFTWNKTMPFVSLPDCQFPRYCAAMDRVSPPTQRLAYKPSRAQVRPGEWSHELFIEIMQSFCPEGGRVLDPFAGVLTTGIACVLTDRACVLLEKEERCLTNATTRLEDFISANLKSERVHATRSGRLPKRIVSREIENGASEEEME